MTTGHCAYGDSCKYKHEEQQSVRMLTQDERAELTMWRRQFANQGKPYTNACRTWTLDGFHTGGSENKKLSSAQIVTEAIREMDSTPMKNSKHDVSKSMTLEDSTPMGVNRAVRKLSKTAKTSKAEKIRMAAKLKP